MHVALAIYREYTIMYICYVYSSLINACTDHDQFTVYKYILQQLPSLYILQACDYYVYVTKTFTSQGIPCLQQ